MSIEDKDLYYIAVKVFLEKEGKFLIIKDGFGDWDLPGGRLLKDEFGVSFEEVVERKIREELGEEVKYKLGDPIIFMRHERTEAVPDNPKSRIFGIGYVAEYQGGEVKLT